MTAENPFRAPDAATGLNAIGFKKPTSSPGKKLHWLLSCFAATSSVYGPYVVMTVYTHAYVGCDHCKRATRELLLCAPAMLPVELGRRTLGIPHYDDWLWFSVSFAIALMWVGGLAWLLSRRRILGAIAASLTVGLGCFLATALLSMIRM